MKNPGRCTPLMSGKNTHPKGLTDTPAEVGQEVTEVQPPAEEYVMLPELK